MPSINYLSETVRKNVNKNKCITQSKIRGCVVSRYLTFKNQYLASCHCYRAYLCLGGSVGRALDFI